MFGDRFARFAFVWDTPWGGPIGRVCLDLSESNSSFHSSLERDMSTRRDEQAVPARPQDSSCVCERGTFPTVPESFSMTAAQAQAQPHDYTVVSQCQTAVCVFCFAILWRNDGSTPLLIAAHRNHPEVVRVLCEVQIQRQGGLAACGVVPASWGLLACVPCFWRLPCRSYGRQGEHW